MSQALHTTGNSSINTVNTYQPTIFNNEYGELLASSTFSIIKKEEGALSYDIISLRGIYEMISLEYAMITLRKHLSEDIIEGIKDEIDIRKLGAFILWFESLFGDTIHIIEIFPFPDIESGKLAFIEIDLDCDEKISLKLSKAIKAYMNQEGFENLSGKVALICQK